MASLMLCLAGCTDNAALTVVGETSLDDGLRAFESQEYDESVSLLSKALERGALNADLMCEARLKRALARIELEEYDLAQEDLDFLMEGAPDTSEVLAAMGRLALKQGDIEQAKKHYAEARKINPAILLPSELR